MTYFLDFRDGFYWHTPKNSQPQLCFVSKMKNLLPRTFVITYLDGSKGLLNQENVSEMSQPEEREVLEILRSSSQNLQNILEQVNLPFLEKFRNFQKTKITERPIYECVKPDDGTWKNRYENSPVTPPRKNISNTLA